MSHTGKRLIGIGLAFAFSATILFAQQEPSLAQLTAPKSPGVVPNLPKNIQRVPVVTCPDLAITAFTAQKVAPDTIKFIGTVKNIGSKDFVSMMYIAGDASLWIEAIFPNGLELYLASWGLPKLAAGQEFTVSPTKAWPLVFAQTKPPGNPVELRFRIKYDPPSTPDCSALNNQMIIPYTTIEQIMK